MDVKLPPLGEGADSGTVVNLFVKEGDQVSKDQPILELENEKAVATIPSSGAGTVTKVYVKPGEKITVGQRLFALTADGKAQAPAKEEKGASKSRPTHPKDDDPEGEEEGKVEDEPGEAETSGDEPQSEEDETDKPQPAASPTIRRLARDLGIELGRVKGSARGGRIVMDDLRAYIQRLQRLTARPKSAATAAADGTASRPAPESIDFSKWGPVSKKPLSPLREVIGRRMAENWNAIPHVTQFDEADLTTLLALRKKHVAAFEKKGSRLTVTSFVLKAVAETLRKHPEFNTSLDEAAKEIVQKDYVHLGIAVDTEAGLIVPVIRDADKKDLVQLSKELEDLATKARERKVSGEELKGGTFTISNQGGIGGAHFTPIINRPEVAILGLGKGMLKPVVRDGKIEPRTMLPLALSYDHRVVDGADAARFIVDLVKAIEQFDEKAVAIKA